MAAASPPSTTGMPPIERRSTFGVHRVRRSLLRWTSRSRAGCRQSPLGGILDLPSIQPVLRSLAAGLPVSLRCRGELVGMRDAVTLLHLSDIQFGRNHRFGNLQAGDPDAKFDTLFSRLSDDLSILIADGV